MYVIGKTGVGKSVLLKNMALQDIRAGRGIGIVDPHGEFVEEVLEQIPPERINDVVYFNPVDADFPIGFNILEVPDVRYKHLVVSDLLGIFTKIWANVWSARMEYILQNCILALIDTPGTTLLGIPRILVEKEYRDKIVANVSDPVVRSFWTQEYETWRDQFRNEAIVPIQNKVGQFLNTGFVRNIVGQPTSTINIADIMNNQKILLVNVSKGRIGEDNAALLGAMIITKIQLAAMERVRIPEEDRVDFYLYVDEFQNFSTDSFAAILSEARKYRLNLLIAHQYVGQLVTDVSTKVRDAVFGNVGTMISFRVGATDAEFLEKEFEPEFMGQDLINLPNYHIYLKLMVDGVTSRPFSAGTLPPLKYPVEPDIRERIINASRSQWSRPREEVEQQITEWNSTGVAHASPMRSRPGASPGQPRGGFAPSGQGRPQSNSGPLATTGASGVQMYDAQCFNCGKMTQVPFKPDGKRPVYCLNCLKQIEEGKLIPLPDRMPSAVRARYGSSLGDLGIEFEAQKSAERIPAPPRHETERIQSPRGSRSAEPFLNTHAGMRVDSGYGSDRPERKERSERPETMPRDRQGQEYFARQPERSAPRHVFGDREDGHRNERTDVRHPDFGDGRPSAPRPSAPARASDESPRVSSTRGGEEQTRERMPRFERVSERPIQDRREQRSSPLPAGVRSRPIVRVPQGSVKLSLQSLKSPEKSPEHDAPPEGVASKREMIQRTHHAASHKEVNTSDLRSMLDEVLNAAQHAKTSSEQKQDSAPPVSSDDRPHEEKKASSGAPPGQILKPGDTIKF